MEANFQNCEPVHILIFESENTQSDSANIGSYRLCTKPLGIPQMTSSPDLPENRAQATHILWEPAIGSGKRITAAVALVGTFSKVRTINLLSPEILSVLHRGKGSNTASQVCMVSDNVKEQLRQKGTLEDRQPPHSGFLPSRPDQSSVMTRPTFLAKLQYCIQAFTGAVAQKKPQRPASRSENEVRKAVRNATKRMIGMNAPLPSNRLPKQ